MKLNNRGFTVVELLASFILTMVIVVFLFEIVLELRNVYINETVRTDVLNKNAIIANDINKMLKSNTISNASCSGSTCTITFITDKGTENKTISVNSNMVTIGNQKVSFPEKVTISKVNLSVTGPVDTISSNDNTILKIGYNAQSHDLDKDIEFNYIYTYAS